jgi:hypothetical protein
LIFDFSHKFSFYKCLDPNPNSYPTFFRIRIQPKRSDSFKFGSTTLALTNAGDGILNAGIGGPTAAVLSIVDGKPNLEQVQGVEQDCGDHATTHPGYQVLHPVYKVSFVTTNVDS